MVSHAHILDTCHEESAKPSFAALQSSGPVTHTHRIAPGDLRFITRRWNPASPGQCRALLEHFDESQGAFEITLLDGTQTVCVYRESTQVEQGPGGWGTATVTLEEVRTWD